MNNYQEALNKVKEKFVISLQCLTSEDKNKQMKYVNILQKLVDTTKTPTLKKIIKEWEELGYEWEKREHIILIYNRNIDKMITLNIPMRICGCFNSDGVGMITTFQEHQLLTKTFKALGVVV